MAALKKAVHESAELRLVAYPGDNTVLLAMSLPDELVSEQGKNLAGFAIWRRVQGGEEKPLYNRIAFDRPVTRATSPRQRKWTPSPAAPFQKFRWIDVPPEGFDKPIRYRVVARYFTGQGTELRDGPGAEIEVAPANPEHASFRASAAAFKKAAVAAGYNPIGKSNTARLPQCEVAFSPRQSASVSLGPAQKAIRGAKTSVLYAVMEPKGSGPVLEALRGIAAKPTIFSYGTVETDKGLAVQNPDGALGELTSYAYLKSKVPEPFVKEWSGGAGKHIHHKFLVVDFNGEKPAVYTGSSNLAAGGEEANGDSLITIHDPLVAGMYAVEAVRLFDHYHFRKAMAAATKAEPLSLWYPGKPKQPAPWWKPYYDPKSIKLRDRLLFADLPLPRALKSRKKADWTALERRR